MPKYGADRHPNWFLVSGKLQTMFDMRRGKENGAHEASTMNTTRHESLNLVLSTERIYLLPYFSHIEEMQLAGHGICSRSKINGLTAMVAIWLLSPHSARKVRIKACTMRTMRCLPRNLAKDTDSKQFLK